MLEYTNINDNPRNKVKFQKQVTEAIPVNCGLENCKFNTKTIRQPISYNPTFDVHSRKEWIVKRNFLALFQQAGKQVITKIRMEKCLYRLKNLNTCSFTNCDEESNIDKKPLNHSTSCNFPILAKIKREEKTANKMSVTNKEIIITDLPKCINPRSPLVYKRLEYKHSKLLDITSCYGDYLRIRKDDYEYETVPCEREEYKHNFHGCLKNNNSLEMMGSSKSRNNHLLKSESALGVNPFPKANDEHLLFTGSLKDTVDCFSQWNHLPMMFFNLQSQKCFMPTPRRSNYADAFLSNLHPPSLN